MEAELQRRADRCENCGRPAGPRFCGHCGQEIEARRGPLLPLLSELLAEWLSLDGRLLRTLRVLWKPGRLTRLYLEGKRAPYLRPLRLYVVASLVLFSSLLDLQAPDASAVNLRIGGELLTEPARSGQPTYSLYNNESFFGRWIASRSGEKIERLREIPPQEILDSLIRGLRRVLPAALIAFLPFLALALKLLYVRTGTHFVDHLVFAVHLQSAVFLALAFVWLLSHLLGLGPIARLLAYLAVGFPVLVVYMVLALRHVYGQTRWLTGLKSLLLLYGYAKLLELVLGVSMLLVIARI